MGFPRNGAGEETRTLDVHLGKVVLYQLSYARIEGWDQIARPTRRQHHLRSMLSEVEVEVPFALRLPAFSSFLSFPE
jgi:hypothetical protein